MRARAAARAYVRSSSFWPGLGAGSTGCCLNYAHRPVRPVTDFSVRRVLVRMCARICALSYICKDYLPKITAHTPVRVSLWLGANVYVCMCIPAHRWLGARLRCLQCVSNGDAAVSHRAIDVRAHACACTKQQYQANSMTSAWTVICIKPPRPSTVRSRYCTDRFDIKLQADSILTHRSRFGEPWVSAPSTPGSLSVL